MHQVVSWTESETTQSAHWLSENTSPPKRIIIADDQMTADAAYRLACEGTGLLWRGDFQNARQLLNAMARRADRKPRKVPTSPTDAFNLHRQAQSQRARTLGMLLLPFNADHSIPLRRAPDARQACIEVHGTVNESYIASLRELLGIISAHEWRKKGVDIPAIHNRIHPHYGVFSPIRGEYIDMVAKAPLPSYTLAFDIGTGTGILAAVLARRGVKQIIATDNSPRAIACARENFKRLQLDEQITLVQTEFFPEGKAPLIVCNPPWIPARPSSLLEHAIFDNDSAMLRGFLSGLASHLEPKGEGWLILSDFAEHLGLRSRDELLVLIKKAGLKVLGRTDVKPHHPRVSDNTDPLHAMRKAELTSLWRLAIS